MGKTTNKLQDYELKYRRGEALTDEEYEKLIRQIQLKELGSPNDSAHIEATIQGQVGKYLFIAGVIVGAGIMYILQAI